MIASFRNRRLESLYNGNERRVAPQHLRKLKRILGLLDISSTPRDMDIPGFRLHSLTGDLRGHYAVRVSANWRVTFRFDEDGNAADVDYADYH